jgi:uncharacterized membrane protein YagU involved in acid resistance
LRIPTDQSNPPAPPRAFDTIVWGGLIVGVLDILDAVTFYGIYRGTTAVGVLQSVAGGVYGREAFNGGTKMAVVGLLLHFLTATLIATAFYFLSRSLPALLQHAVVVGLAYGAVVYFVMTYVVVPLSAYGPRTGPIPWPVQLNGIVGHALLVGLPIALIAYWSAKANRRAPLNPS